MGHSSIFKRKKGDIDPACSPQEGGEENVLYEKKKKIKTR